MLKQLEHQYLEDRMAICDAMNSDIYTAHGITLEESVIVFIILAVGIAAALLALVLEILVKHGSMFYKYRIRQTEQVSDVNIV